MASFSRQYSTASPVLAILPHPPHQPPLSTASLAHQHAPATTFGAGAVGAPPSAPCLAAGRKRSRDEASINLEPDVHIPMADESHEGWTYGEGMVPIKPEAGYVADASSQSGTWLEEKSASDEQARRRQQVEQQLDLRSHKTQRIDHSIDQTSPPSAPIGDAAGVSGTNVAAVDSAREQLVIDDFTLHLGIGWRRISDDEDIQAAARGWARFVENHFPLTTVRMCLESKGLQAYLVEASEGYFLFAENLRQGRLVSRTVDGALRNLQLSPPTFDGPEIQMEAENPRPSEPLADTEMKID
ncbi:hypothetical protein TOPH_01361 [Tolypocladium ophioglossoides CBS 100239]|uniref:Uncharacterized protein n=1 Tax=Tolypocladium ophioglossoides (strain CBS 100239) TaxID=1163406 RepID=A0A0L0NKR3_TOLOC|nr:hypothetical protein TOPH_01361 [Tolypocladium ophioglossoides CBS 100239]